MNYVYLSFFVEECSKHDALYEVYF